MNIKKKTLALMVGIACSGLLYGVNANADGIEGNTTTDLTIKSFMNALTADTVNEANPNVYLPDNSNELIKMTSGLAKEKPNEISDFNGYLKAVADANSTNKHWYEEFNLLADSDRTDTTNGLFAKLSDNLNNTPTLTKFNNGKASNVVVTSEDEAVNTILTLIELGQQAKATDTAKGDVKEKVYNQFLVTNKANLVILGVVNQESGKLDGTTAARTFTKFVTTGEGANALSSTPLSKVKSNMKFIKESAAFLANSGNFSNEMKVALQKLNGQSGAIGADQKLSNNLTGENDSVIAPKGTKLGIKNNTITYNGVELSSDNAPHLIAFVEKGLRALDKVAIDKSNVQGSGNTVLAKSEAILGADGFFYNLAEGMTALGNDNIIESNSVTIGNNNTVGENSIALGTGNKVGKNGTAVGNGSQATAPNAIAFGNDAVAAHANSVALGSNSRTTRDNEINVGMWTLNDVSKEYTQTARIITGVANGTEDDHAVNYKQLTDLKADSRVYADNAAKKEAKTAADTALENSKIYTDGEIKTANTNNRTYTDDKVATLGKVANTYTDNKVNGLKQEMNSKIDALDKKVNKGFAANAALSGLFQPYGVGKINMTAGVGGYQSESAVAVGVGYRVNENVAVKGGIATAVGNGSSTMYNASVNFEW